MSSVKEVLLTNYNIITCGNRPDGDFTRALYVYIVKNGMDEFMYQFTLKILSENAITSVNYIISRYKIRFKYDWIKDNNFIELLSNAGVEPKIIIDFCDHLTSDEKHSLFSKLL